MTEGLTHDRFDQLCAEIEEYDHLPAADPSADMFIVAPGEEQVVYMDDESISALVNPWHAATA